MSISPPTEQESEGSVGISRDRLGRHIWKNPVLLVVTGFGAGLIPYVPGTAGTLVAIPLYLFIAPLSPTIYTGIVLLLFALGVAMCRQAERQLAIHDHPAVVWDEIVGYLVTMFLPGSRALGVGGRRVCSIPIIRYLETVSDQNSRA